MSLARKPVAGSFKAARAAQNLRTLIWSLPLRMEARQTSSFCCYTILQYTWNFNEFQIFCYINIGIVPGCWLAPRAFSPFSWSVFVIHIPGFRRVQIMPPSRFVGSWEMGGISQHGIWLGTWIVSSFHFALKDFPQFRAEKTQSNKSLVAWTCFNGCSGYKEAAIQDCLLPLAFIVFSQSIWPECTECFIRLQKAIQKGWRCWSVWSVTSFDNFWQVFISFICQSALLLRSDRSWRWSSLNYAELLPYSTSHIEWDNITHTYFYIIYNVYLDLYNHLHIYIYKII